MSDKTIWSTTLIQCFKPNVRLRWKADVKTINSNVRLILKADVHNISSAGVSQKPFGLSPATTGFVISDL